MSAEATPKPYTLLKTEFLVCETKSVGEYRFGVERRVMRFRMVVGEPLGPDECLEIGPVLTGLTEEEAFRLAGRLNRESVKVRFRAEAGLTPENVSGKIADFKSSLALAAEAVRRESFQWTWDRERLEQEVKNASAAIGTAQKRLADLKAQYKSDAAWSNGSKSTKAQKAKFLIECAAKHLVSKQEAAKRMVEENRSLMNEHAVRIGKLMHEEEEVAKKLKEAKKYKAGLSKGRAK